MRVSFWCYASNCHYRREYRHRAAPWLLWFVAAGFLSWAFYQYFVVPRGRSAKPQSPDAPGSAGWSSDAGQRPLVARREMKVFLDTDRFDPPESPSTPEPVAVPGRNPRNKRSPGRSLRWRAPGEMVQLKSGHRIAGMIYTASGLVRGVDEPSAINEGWQVGSFPHPFREASRSWASYRALSPQQRRAYLDWLAADRLNRGTTPINSGQLFLFFYGLERRLVWDGDWDSRLFDEMFKLLKAYGSGKHADSFKSYALSLLHFVGYRCGRYAELLPRIAALDQTRAFKSGALYLLAHLHKTGQPLRESFALALATMESSCRKSALTIQVNRELTVVFQHRFAQSWPEGITLIAAKEPFHVRYHPASASLALSGSDRMTERLPIMIGLFGESGSFQPSGTAVWPISRIIPARSVSLSPPYNCGSTPGERFRQSFAFQRPARSSTKASANRTPSQ